MDKSPVIFNTIGKKLKGKRDSFTEQLVQVTKTFKLKIPTLYASSGVLDHYDAFYYCDRPYYNSYYGLYDGYIKEGFEMQLKALKNCEEKFLLSSYPSEVLNDYAKNNGWCSQKMIQHVSATKTTRGQEKKTEMLTANYDLNNPYQNPLLII